MYAMCFHVETGVIRNTSFTTGRKEGQLREENYQINLANISRANYRRCIEKALEKT